MQASPFLVNKLNALMELTSESSPLVLGYNNENIIAIVGDVYYVLDEDHLLHQDVDISKIPAIDRLKKYDVFFAKISEPILLC